MEKFKSDTREEVIPMEVRIMPGDSNVRTLFTAMVQAAYEMDRKPGINGLAPIGQPDMIEEKEASRFLIYDTERTLLDSILFRPDNRIPKGVYADHIRGKAVKLDIYESEEFPGSYDMMSHVFEREVGSIDDLFRRTMKKLDT